MRDVLGITKHRRIESYESITLLTVAVVVWH